MKRRQYIGETIFLLSILLGAAWGAEVCAQEVKIALIDSGATQNFHFGKTFTSLKANQDKAHHGTIMANLVREGYPQAEIYMLQVTDKVEGGYRPIPQAVKDAIKWSIQNGMDVVNMSICVKYDPEIDRLLNEAAEKHGMLILAASGNLEFDNYCNDYVDSEKKIVTPIFPASNEHVIAVGGVNPNGKIAQYSSNKASDIYALGVWGTKFGSSIATARATAQLAKIKEKNPHFNKKEIIAFLKKVSRKKK